MARVAIEPGIVVLPERDDAAPRLLASRCDECGAVFHPPRPVCLACHGRTLSETSLAGNGSLHACTRVQMPLRPSMRTQREYWVAHVDLDDGPRVQGILSPDIGEPRIGMRLSLALETLRIDDKGGEIVVHHFRAAGDRS